MLGVNPFDQPDIEGSKVATRKLTSEFEKNGAMGSEAALRQGDGLVLYTDVKNARELDSGGGDKTVVATLKAHFGRVKAGDYVALLPYLEMSPTVEAEMQGLRALLRDKLKAATSVGFGPRYLHSSGQAYKGGANKGVFLMITADDAADVPVPGHKYTFGVVKAAQARGDFSVLAERGRRVLRVHLGKDVKGGLAALNKAIQQAIG